MNTILVATDFSAPAKNAAVYALHLATHFHANILLFNAVEPNAAEIAGPRLNWHPEAYRALKDETISKLKSFADGLRRVEQLLPGHPHYPEINYTCQIGPVANVMQNIADEEEIALIVMGTAAKGGLAKLFSRSDRINMIDDAILPLLLIPSTAVYKNIKKIAFASGLHSLEMEAIKKLSVVAMLHGTEILIANVNDKKFEHFEYEHHVNQFIRKVVEETNYPNVHYRRIMSIDIDHGLDWLAEHGQVDMLAIMHRQLPPVRRMVNGSHTMALAMHAEVPLLVFPCLQTESLTKC